MQIIKEIYLNLYDQPVVNVYAKQGDNGRYIKATILDNAIVYTIPADASARIASGGVWNNCTVSNNSVMACLTPDMLKPGQNLCQIELIQGNTKLTTVSFILSVEKSARNDIAIEGSTEFGTLDKAITDAQKVINEAETAEATRKTAETARASAESTRKSQETARVNAEAARVSAENTRKSQETARGTAESTRATAENTRKSQETARVNAEAARVTEFTTLKADSESATAKALAAAGGDISEKTVNYTESTAATAPASGSKLSAISGWLIGKVKNLVARMGTAETSITALNSNLLLINADSDTSEGSSFNKNFLLTGSATPGATPQRSAYFSKPADDTDWVNMPTALQGKLWVGYRQVYRRSSVNILIRIIEMYPSDGRIWTNFYNNGAWRGWKSITPQ